MDPREDARQMEYTISLRYRDSDCFAGEITLMASNEKEAIAEAKRQHGGNVFVEYITHTKLRR